MSPNVLTIIGGLLTAFLGGGLVKALLDYVGNRGKARSDYALSTLTNLQEWNASLQKRIRELEEELDRERRSRRDLENRVAALERDQPSKEDPVA